MTHRHHAAARAVPRPAARPAMRACCRATTAATTASSTGCRRPRATFRDDLLADMPVDELLIAPISEIADHWRDAGSVQNPVARRDRRSGSTPSTSSDSARSLARTPTMRERLFTAERARVRRAEGRSGAALAARFAAREAVMKALGLGLGAFGFHDVWVERARSRARRRCVVEGSGVGAGRRARRASAGTCRSRHTEPRVAHRRTSCAE